MNALIPVVTSRRLYELIPSPVEHITLWQIARDLEFGLQRRWNGECETYTAAGLEEMALRLEGRGFPEAAKIVREELRKLQEPLPAPPPHKTRSHLPYADKDDEESFSHANSHR